MDSQTHTLPTLSRNDQLVLDTLTRAGGALSAYALLDTLRPEGLRAPPQIYRALKSLCDHGLVHKLTSTNTYIACAHATCCGGAVCQGSQSVFFLCDACGRVDEVGAASVGSQLNGLAKEIGFALSSAALEVRGRCAACRAA